MDNYDNSINTETTGCNSTKNHQNSIFHKKTNEQAYTNTYTDNYDSNSIKTIEPKIIKIQSLTRNQ